jgi:hypothetical protein
MVKFQIYLSKFVKSREMAVSVYIAEHLLYLLSVIKFARTKYKGLYSCKIYVN